MRTSVLGASAALALLAVLSACSPQSAAPPASDGAATAAPKAATAVATPADPRLNPTAATGGGINSSNAVSADDLKAALASIPQIDKLRLTANSSPAGATGSDVLTLSIVAQDTGGLVASLDSAGKKTLGEAILTAAGATWPKASISLLVSGGGSSIVGSRQPGGPNMVVAS